MPNYCRTYLRVSVDPWDIADGKPTEQHRGQAVAILEDFREVVRGEYGGSDKLGAFVFHQIIPQPDAFHGIISGSCTIDGEHVRLWREENNEPVRVPQEEIDELIAQHGAANWYDWNCEHWGTKWDTSLVAERHSLDVGEYDNPELNYSFQTAWNPPEPIIATLRDRFPRASISYFWCEEGGRSGGDDAYWILECWMKPEPEEKD